MKAFEKGAGVLVLNDLLNSEVVWTWFTPKQSKPIISIKNTATDSSHLHKTNIICVSCSPFGCV